jgi:hypothetical protein
VSRYKRQACLSPFCDSLETHRASSPFSQKHIIKNIPQHDNPYHGSSPSNPCSPRRRLFGCCSSCLGVCYWPSLEPQARLLQPGHWQPIAHPIRLANRVDWRWRRKSITKIRRALLAAREHSRYRATPLTLIHTQPHQSYKYMQLTDNTDCNGNVGCEIAQTEVEGKRSFLSPKERPTRAMR